MQGRVLSELVQGEDVSLLSHVVGRCPGLDPASPAPWMRSPKLVAAAATAAWETPGEGQRGTMPRTLLLPMLCSSWP